VGNVVGQMDGGRIRAIAPGMTLPAVLKHCGQIKQSAGFIGSLLTGSGRRKIDLPG